MAYSILLVLWTAVVVASEPSGNGTSEEAAGESFNGVYSECFLDLSYTCLQRKTLLYLKELNKLKEVSVIGDYVKFVKLNSSETDNETESSSTEELAQLIDGTVERFFQTHLLRVTALGRDLMVPETVEEFVGRKKKGGGEGGGGHGGDDGGKKKMMMMAMMCMKMKFMMMVPAMMGMMGMMTFKGMMFSMISSMLSKGWSGGGGAWMPAGQDGGGYDANGQWQSRSIIENEKPNKPIVAYVKPITRYNNKINEPKPLILIKNLKDEVIKIDQVKGARRKRSTEERPRIKRNISDGINISRQKRRTVVDVRNSEREHEILDDIGKYKKVHKVLEDISVSREKRETSKSEPSVLDGNESKNDVNSPVDIRTRKGRSIIDDLRRAYIYWANQILGVGYKKPVYPKYKMVNGVKYVYLPIRANHRLRTPKELNNNDLKPLNIGEFIKGEIVEPAEGRMNKKKFVKMKDNVNETMDENPWE